MNIQIVRRSTATFAAWLFLLCMSTGAWADVREYVLGPGDIVRISIFQNPDLTTEARVSESGALTFPLIGAVSVGGQSIAAAEKLIASRLRDGGFVRQPQVTILPLQIRGNQVAVLGKVERPGRYPLETFDQRLVDLLAVAGGISPDGSDVVTLTGVRDGRPVTMEIDVPALFMGGDASDNVSLSGGDVIYVHREPVFYIYGEVQRAGTYRLERGMSVIQALATGGGLTQRGTMRGLQIHRRDEAGTLQVIRPELDDPLQPNDVVHIREALF